MPFDAIGLDRALIQDCGSEGFNFQCKFVNHFERAHEAALSDLSGKLASFVKGKYWRQRSPPSRSLNEYK